jgi:hypothetical protein
MLLQSGLQSMGQSPRKPCFADSESAKESRGSNQTHQKASKALQQKGEPCENSAAESKPDVVGETVRLGPCDGYGQLRFASHCGLFHFWVARVNADLFACEETEEQKREAEVTRKVFEWLPSGDNRIAGCRCPAQGASD